MVQAWILFVCSCLFWEELPLKELDNVRGRFPYLGKNGWLDKGDPQVVIKKLYNSRLSVPGNISVRYGLNCVPPAKRYLQVLTLHIYDCHLIWKLSLHM